VVPAETVARSEVGVVSLDIEPTEFSFGTESPAAEDVAEFGLPIEEEYLYTGKPEPLAAPEETGAFSFGEAVEEPVEPFALGVEEMPLETASPFEAPSAPEEPTPSLPDQQFAPEEEYVPAPAAVAAAAPGTITLTEEQLAAAISRISKEVIERIAWEVVPDLAEALIKEEIRRIKEGK
jgi:hypothetical protein